MKNAIYYLLIFGLLLISCKQSTKTTSDEIAKATVADSTQTTKAETFTYDPRLDLYEADKEVITQLGDTLGMKLVLIDQEKGEAMPWHAHPLHHSYYFYEGKRGEASEDGIFWMEFDLPFSLSGIGGIGGVEGTEPHSGAVNLDETHIKCIDLDIYDRSEMETTKPFEYDPKKDLYNLKSESVKQLADTLGIKMYLIDLQPGDSIKWWNGFNHPKHAVFVMEGGKIEPSLPTPPGGAPDVYVKTGTGAIRNATEESEKAFRARFGKDVYYIKNIDDHPIKFWFTDVYTEE
ncbi:hypothetical protein OOZ15_09635 [Galbibacter sp. EGI 63066]|uniref:hypothetical protein n=1 Tax=Galbibacter sp. EGI 63066 TaxID=2993559 RepID=UPI0022497EFF|nr:hypothetical protein [Galbibacter sp. EGI 63066]MCX2680198.1 hypothetical protein [Galbibacter sp. EGI 63066]